MLRHLGEVDAARTFEDAVFVTLDEGRAVTLDVARQTGDVEEATSTSGFTDAIIANLGRTQAERLASRASPPATPPASHPRWERRAIASQDARTVGVDVYAEADLEPAVLGRSLEALAGPDFRLELISARGTVVHPAENLRVDTVGWWRCRFRLLAPGDEAANDAAIVGLLGRIGSRHSWMHVQKLRLFGSEEGYTRAQGQ
jgi:isocitrate dehydrogenase